MNSEQNMHELGNEVTSEDLEPPANNSRNIHAMESYPDEGPFMKCSIMECGKSDMNYESEISQVIADLNKETSVAYLQKELEILRTSNKKLQEKLTQEDKDRRKLELKLELQEKAAEAEIAERTAALVEEVYFAQRERDEAIMCRLQLALEERDEAVARMKHMEMSLKMLENINPEENDMTLQELLSRINNADTGIAIEKNGALIVDRIYKTKECKRRITAEEMKAVIEERDAAVSQCKRLHRELHRLKEQKQTSANNTRHPTAENNQERALKEKLLSMQQAKETAVEQYKRLEEEIQTLRVYYSLHKSLSQEENLKDQFNHALSTYEEALKNRESVVSITQQQNEELATQLEQALTQQANMELQLQCALEVSQAANEKVQKLERLVDVLRKKVGTGALRTVI
ncbi:mirror-image polydactyly gene 1 protein [Microtus oregoni]|uniref:mirror-image polydactyly gene 1 protein n=1 Tax=Microtus oregoni TaxID=111838 RepID=UPI001BB2692F|nr:mirror-image polydactyly gene 1 protein [Microtus oregoni]XP_041514459.1 mirror-image polydactyly gene 1 protein [Microtus oregoni]